ncbi:hypothetical protein PG996_006682 [Apiospora saccharicola]|uniref:Uncharacterized protein n=1 Tax=Apiospora saccharicola TaxID=335842 RepID=A0ABR1V8P7_9PEZI
MEHLFFLFALVLPIGAVLIPWANPSLSAQYFCDHVAVQAGIQVDHQTKLKVCAVPKHPAQSHVFADPFQYLLEERIVLLKRHFDEHTCGGRVGRQGQGWEDDAAFGRGGKSVVVAESVLVSGHGNYEISELGRRM